MPNLRHFWLASLISLFLVACGGGSSIDDSSYDNVGGGGGSDPVDVSNYSFDIQLTNADGDTIEGISSAQPGVFDVLVMDGSSPVAGEIVTVSSTIGVLQSGNGQMLTNADGEFSVVINAGAAEGAGTFTVAYQDENDSINFTTAGDGDDTASGNANYTLTLKLYSDDGVSTTNSISYAESGLLVATLTTDAGEAVPNQVITFASEKGEIAFTTDLTDENGQAQAPLTAGTEKAAGIATASFGDIKAPVSFKTAGDKPTEVTPSEAQLSLWNCNDEDANPQFLAGCFPTEDISLSQPGTLVIDVTRANGGDPIDRALVNVTTDIGSVSPSNGRVLTNENGRAYVQVLAGDADGAVQITVEVNDKTITEAYTIGSAEIVMGSGTVLPNGSVSNFTSNAIDSGLANNESLAIGSTAAVTVTIVDTETGRVYTDPLDVNFSSSCVAQSLASIDEVVASFNGQATAIYKPNGCVEDTINASTTAGTKTLTATTQISMVAAEVAAIEFVDLSINGDSEARILSFPGTGQAQIAKVNFLVLDENGLPAANEKICFDLSTEVGGITLTPNTDIKPAATFTDGTVQVQVQSGKVATPVRVIASLAKDDGTCFNQNQNNFSVSNVSDLMTISTGIPDQNSVTLALENVNVEAWDWADTEVGVTMYLADHFNNPVPNGTAVSFITEGGVIQPSCITDNGRCSVAWTSTAPKPGKADSGLAGTNIATGVCDLNKDGFADAGEPDATGQPCVIDGLPYPLVHAKAGRVTVVAYAIGEESFVDANADGYYTSGESFGDLDEVFVDHNRDGYFCGRQTGSVAAPGAETNAALCRNGGDAEEFIDYNFNGTFDKKDSQFAGILCSEADANAGICTRELTHVRDTAEIVMSGSTPYFYFADTSASNDLNLNNDMISSVDLTFATGTDAETITVYITDINNNPMPVGTTVEFATANGELVGETSFEFVNTSTDQPTPFSISVKREKVGEGNEALSGPLSVTVTTPRGVKSAASITIIDDQ